LRRGLAGPQASSSEEEEGDEEGASSDESSSEDGEGSAEEEEEDLAALQEEWGVGAMAANPDEQVRPQQGGLVGYACMH
jgi:hypothetical protein